MTPRLVVLHYTGMDSAQAALDRLCDPEPQVSAHYLVARDGAVHRLVAEDRRAWHAGAGGWGACTDVNSASIGIELDNPGPLRGFPPFPERQMAALERLLAGIIARHGIAPADVIGHSDMAPGRKADPGPKFDWTRLARQGLARPRPPAGGECDLARALTAMGYPEADPQARLDAFRLRWRQGASGPEDAEDRRIAAALAR